MKKQIFSPQGTEIRELTKQERDNFAAQGDYEAKKEIAKEKIAAALSLQDELDAIKEVLGL